MTTRAVLAPTTGETAGGARQEEGAAPPANKYSYGKSSCSYGRPTGASHVGLSSGDSGDSADHQVTSDDTPPEYIGLHQLSPCQQQQRQVSPSSCQQQTYYNPHSTSYPGPAPEVYDRPTTDLYGPSSAYDGPPAASHGGSPLYGSGERSAGSGRACVFLCNRDMWVKFHEHTTEMIITKQGR